MTTKTRDIKQDIIKGLGILTVVDYHSIVTTSFGKILKFGWSSSLMLIFFLLAGMNYTSGKRTLAENIKRRCEGVLRPLVQYVVLTTLLCGTWIVASGLMTPMEILSSVIKFLIQGFRGEDATHITICLIPDWFLGSLFLASLLFFVFDSYICKTDKKIWVCIILFSLISAILFALNIDIPFWHIQAVPGFTAVMFLGQELKKKDLLSKIPTQLLQCICIFVISAFLSIILYYYFHGAIDLSQGIWGTVGFWSLPLAFAVMILNFLSYYSLATIAEKVPVISKLLIWFGQHSLNILMIHFPILMTLGAIIGWDAGADVQTFSWLVYFRDVALFIMTLVLSFLWCLLADWYKKKKLS